MKFYTALEKEEKKWRREGFGGGGIKKDMEVTADVTKNIEHTITRDRERGGGIEKMCRLLRSLQTT